MSNLVPENAHNIFSLSSSKELELSNDNKIKSKKRTKFKSSPKSSKKSKKDFAVDISDKETENIDADLSNFAKSLKTEEVLNSDSSTDTVAVDNINHKTLNETTKYTLPTTSHSFIGTNLVSHPQGFNSNYDSGHTLVNNSLNQSHLENVLLGKSDYVKSFFGLNSHPYFSQIKESNKPLNFCTSNKAFTSSNLQTSGRNALFTSLGTKDNQNLINVSANELQNDILKVPVSSTKETYKSPNNASKSSSSTHFTSSSASVSVGALYKKQTARKVKRKEKNVMQISSAPNSLNNCFNTSNLPRTASDINFQSVYPSMGLDVDLCDLKTNNATVRKHCGSSLKADEIIALPEVNIFPDIPIKVEMDITPPSNFMNTNEEIKFDIRNSLSPNLDSSNDVHVSMTFEVEPSCDDFDDDLPLSLLKEKALVDEISSVPKDNSDNADANSENGSDDIPLSLFIKKELIDEEIVAASQEISSETVTSRNYKEYALHINEQNQVFTSEVKTTDKKSDSSSMLTSNSHCVTKIKTEPVDEYLVTDELSNISTQISTLVTSTSDSVKGPESNYIISESRTKDGPNGNAFSAGDVLGNNCTLNSEHAGSSYPSNVINISPDCQNSSTISSSYLVENAHTSTAANCNIYKPDVPISSVNYTENQKILPTNTTTSAHSVHNPNVKIHSDNNRPVLSCSSPGDLNKKHGALNTDQATLKSSNNLISGDLKSNEKSLLSGDLKSDNKSNDVLHHSNENAETSSRYVANLDVELVKEIKKDSVPDSGLLCNMLSDNFSEKMHTNQAAGIATNITLSELGNKKKMVKRKYKKKKSDNSVDLDDNMPITLLIKKKKTGSVDENATDSLLCTSLDKATSPETNSNLKSNEPNFIRSGPNQKNSLNCSPATNSVVECDKSNLVTEKDLPFNKSNGASASQTPANERNFKKKKERKKSKSQKHASPIDFETSVSHGAVSNGNEFSNKTTNISNNIISIDSQSNLIAKTDESALGNKDSNSLSSQAGKNSSETIELKNNTLVYMSFEEHLPTDDTSEEDIHSILSIKTENDISISSSDALVSESTSDMLSVLNNIKKEKDMPLDSESCNTMKQSENICCSQQPSVSVSEDGQLATTTVNVSANSEAVSLKDANNSAFDNSHETALKTVTSAAVVTKKKKKRPRSNGWYKKKKSRSNTKRSPLILSKSPTNISETSESVASVTIEKMPVVMVENVLSRMKDITTKNMEDVASPIIRNAADNIEVQENNGPLITENIPLEDTDKVQEDNSLYSNKSNISSRAKGKRKKKVSWSRKKRKVASKSRQKLGDSSNSDVSPACQSSVLSEENVRNHVLNNSIAETLSRSTSEETLIVPLDQIPSVAENDNGKKVINATNTLDPLSITDNSMTESKLFNPPSLNIAEIEKEIAEIDRILPSFLANRSNKANDLENQCNNKTTSPEVIKNSSFQGTSSRPDYSKGLLVNVPLIKKEPSIDSYTEDQFLKACTTGITSASISNVSSTSNSDKSFSSSANELFSEGSRFTPKTVKNAEATNSVPVLASFHDKVALSVKKEVCDSLQSDLSKCNSLSTIKNKQDLINKTYGVHDKNVINSSSNLLDNRSNINFLSSNVACSNKSLCTTIQNRAVDDDEIQIIKTNPKSSSNQYVDLTENNMPQNSSGIQRPNFPVNDISSTSGELLIKRNKISNVSVHPDISKMSSDSHSLKSSSMQSNIESFQSKERNSKPDFPKEVPSALPKKTVDFKSHKYVTEYFRYPFPASISSHNTKQKNKYALYTRIDTKSWNLSLENVESRLKSENSLSQLDKHLDDIVKLEKYPVSSYEVECYHRILGVAPSHKLISKCFRSADKKVSTIVNDEFNTLSQYQKSSTVNKFQSSKISDKIACSINDIIQEMSEGKLVYNDSKIYAELDDSFSTCTRDSCDSYVSSFSEKFTVPQTSEFRNLNNLLLKESEMGNSCKKIDTSSISSTSHFENYQNINNSCKGIPMYSDTFHDANSCKKIASSNTSSPLCSETFCDVICKNIVPFMNSPVHSETFQEFKNDLNSLQHSVNGQNVNSMHLNSVPVNLQSDVNYLTQPKKETFHEMVSCDKLNTQLPLEAHETCNFPELENKALLTSVPQIQANSIMHSSSVIQNTNENSNIIQNPTNKILSNIDVPVTELRKILETAGSLPATKVNDSTLSWRSKRTFEYNHTHSIPVVEMNSENHKLKNQDFSSQPAHNYNNIEPSVNTLNNINTSEAEIGDLSRSSQNNLNGATFENSDDDYVDNEPINDESDVEKDEISDDSKKQVEEKPVQIPQYKSKWEKIMERKSLENEKKQKINEHLLKDCFPVSSVVKKYVKPKQLDKSILMPVSEKPQKSKKKESDKEDTTKTTKKNSKGKCKESSEMDSKQKTDKNGAKQKIDKDGAKQKTDKDGAKQKNGKDDVKQKNDKGDAKQKNDKADVKQKIDKDHAKQKIDKDLAKQKNDKNHAKQKNNNDSSNSSPKKIQKQFKKPIDDASTLFSPDKTLKSINVKKTDTKSKSSQDMPSKRFYGNRVTNRGSFLTESSDLLKSIKIPKKKTSEMKKSSNTRSEEYHSMVNSPLIRIDPSISHYNTQKKSFTNSYDSRYRKRPTMRNSSSAKSNFQNIKPIQYKRTLLNSPQTVLSHLPSEDSMHGEKVPLLNTPSMHSEKVPLLSIPSVHSETAPLLNTPSVPAHLYEGVPLKDPRLASLSSVERPSCFNNESIQTRNAPLLNNPCSQYDSMQSRNVPLLNAPSPSHLSLDNFLPPDSSPSSSLLQSILSAINVNNMNFLGTEIQDNLLPFSDQQNTLWPSSSLTGRNNTFLNGNNFKSGMPEESSVSNSFGQDLPSTNSFDILKPIAGFLPTSNSIAKSTPDTSIDSTSQMCSKFIPVNSGDHVISQTSRKPTNTCLIPQHLKSLVGHQIIETNNVLLLMLEWSVDWLVQQQKLHDPPPISDALKKVVSSYDSFEDYYNTYFPLMLLDTWHRIYVSWTHLSQASPYFCEITSYSVKNHNINVECQTVFNTTSHPKGVFPDEGSILMIKYGTKSNEFTIKILGYVTHVKTRRFNPVTDSKMCGFKPPKDGNFDVLQVLTLTYMGAYNSEDIDKRLPVRIHVLCNVKSTLKQNDAMLYISKSPLFKSILNPVEDGLLSVSLTPRNSPEEKVNDCVRDITRGILSPHPVPLLTIVRAKPESDRLNIIPLLIDKMKNTYKTKVLLCVRTVRALGDIAANICLHDSIKLVIVNKRCDTNYQFQQYLIDELVTSEIAKTSSDKQGYERLHLKNEVVIRTKKQILKECDVILSLIRNCHDDFMAETFLETESIAHMCCIVDEANLCTEPETLIPILHGVSKLILIGDPDYPAKVLSKTANSYDYHRSFFNRAFDLDSLTE